MIIIEKHFAEGLRQLSGTQEASASPRIAIFLAEWASRTAVYPTALRQHLGSTAAAVQTQGECRQENSGSPVNAYTCGSLSDLDQSLTENAYILMEMKIKPQTLKPAVLIC